MKKFKTWSALVLIFISGVVIGAVVSSVVMRHHVKGLFMAGPARANHRIVMEATRGMDLTDEQHSRIDEILEEYRPKLETMTSEFADSMKAFTEEQHAKIKEVLTEEQQKVLDERFANIRKRFRDARDRHRFDGRRRDGRRMDGRGRMHPSGDDMPPPPPPPDSSQAGYDSIPDRS
jgi:Spy/CpxP family protein refolding chaperone